MFWVPDTFEPTAPSDSDRDADNNPVLNGNVPIVEIFLGSPVDLIHSRDEHGRTALQLARENNLQESVDLLVPHFARLEGTKL